jgi:hypothetical protein
VSEQASKALFSLYRLFDHVILTIADKLKLFDCMILPILNYGCEMWGFHCASDVENVHLRFLRYLRGVKQQTNSAAVYGELGRAPLDIVRNLNIGSNL